MMSRLILAALVATVAVRGAEEDEGSASPYSEQIGEGLEYFKSSAATARPKVVALRDAVEAGDVTAAQAAYIASRNEYEQIEVLAPGFPDIDCSIDCRAYAYDHGEGTSADGVIGLSEFQGFHRIENFLFRDGVTEPALPYAEGLLTLWDALELSLDTPADFSFCGWFEGVIGLANEVAAKKISSEEETYSDQSILIFYNNFEGIQQAVEPFMAAFMAANATGAEELEKAFMTADASIATYVTGETYAAYSGVPNAERQAIQAAAYGLRDGIINMQAALAEAESVEECAEEEEEEEECVHPEPVEALEQRTVGADYFKAIYTENKAQLDAFVTLTGTASVTLAELQAAYALARPLYEQIEVLAPAFSAEDTAIDARPDAYALGEFDPEFQGWHRIERMLYRDELTTGANDFTDKTLEEWALQLQTTYVALGEKIEALPGPGLESADVFDGVLGVMAEVAAKKISSEEETFSDLSLMIYHNNWLGGYSQILPFATMDGAESEANLTAAYEAAVECIAPHVTGTVPTCLPMTTAEEATAECMQSVSTIEYASYRSIDILTRECIVEKGMALREVMIDIANNLGVAHTCHNFHRDNVFDYRHATLIEAEEGVTRTTSLESEEGEGEGITEEGEEGGVTTQLSLTAAALATLLAVALM